MAYGLWPEVQLLAICDKRYAIRTPRFLRTLRRNRGLVDQQEPLYLSPINIAEMQFGLEMLRAGARKQKAAAALRRLRRKPQLRITVETAEVFGALAAALKKAGRDADFRIHDLWLAAQAIQRDFTLLTSNAKDFEDIPRLKMIAMRVP